METHSQNQPDGFLDTCTCEGGSGIFAFVYTIIAIGFLLSIIIFG